MSISKQKPVIGITIGDINGIGPEVILRTLADNRITNWCTPVIYGSAKVVSYYRNVLNFNKFIYNQTNNIEQIHHGKINVLNCWVEEVDITPGQITSDGGKYAHTSLEIATNDVVSGRTDAIVTAPINKHNIQSDTFQFPGHTEYLARQCESTNYLMLMCSDELRIGVVTGHVPIAEVSRQLTKERVVAKAETMHKTLQNDFSIPRPKIAILGLNPHAGDNGLIGKEDQEVIIPAIEELRNKHIIAVGPFSADGFFGKYDFKKFDAVLAMYHDQGLVPFKIISFENGVNFTAGIPIIRTSPDHGVAYDIAGKNMADESSFRSALYMAIDLVKNRQEKSVEVE